MAIPEHGQTSKVSPYQQPRPAQPAGVLEAVPSPSPSPSPSPVPVIENLDEPFDSAKWLDARANNLVEHPLMRALLLELPPKGAQPSPEWMNRWFDAVRAVLDLIYNSR